MHVARWPSSPRAAPTSQAGQGVAVGENVYEAVSVSATVVRATRVQKIGASNRRASTTSARVCSFSAAVHTAQPQDHLFPYCTGALHRSCSLEKNKISTVHALSQNSSFLFPHASLPPIFPKSWPARCSARPQALCARLRVELVELIGLFDCYGTGGARGKPGEETEPGTER